MTQVDLSDQVECISLDDTSRCSALLNHEQSTDALIIISINIRSINCNFDLLVAFIAAINMYIDVIVLTECWINLNNPPPDMTGYSKYWTKTSINKNDGVVVYVRSEIPTDVHEPKIMEGNCLIITINLDYTIICSYRSPSFKIPKPYLESLDSILCTTTTKHVILTGDINIDTSPQRLSIAAQEYLFLMAMHGLKPGINKPTRINTCIDHFMVKCTHRWKTIVFEQPITDHRPILLYINSSKIARNNVGCKKTVINYKEIKNILTNEIWQDLYNATDANVAAEFITTKLLNITNTTKILKTSSRFKPLKPWITKGIVKCIRKRDKLHRTANKTPNNILLMSQYHKYRNTCNYIIKQLKNRYYQERLGASKGNIKETWKIVKEVCDMKKSSEPSLELLNIATTPNDSLNKVNNYFTGVGGTLANELLGKMMKSEKELCQMPSTATPPLKSMSFIPTDPHEVKSAILGLRSHSAPGWDKITTDILKQNVYSLASPITYMCNLSLVTGTFPTIFKQAIVCPIFKSGNKSEPSNYRPISLLSTLSKILEKLVNKRVVNYLETNKLLSDEQFGFREGKSTEDAVLTLTSTIVSYLDKGEKCLGVFLDLQKAFDTVSIPILLTRLEKIGIRGVVLDWFKSYLTARQQRVKVDTYESGDSACKCGVPQGSTLGPTLFLIYINSLCELSTPPYLDLLMFADDTVLIFHGFSWNRTFELAEIGMAKITTWLEDSLLSLNTNKTKYICFSKTKAGKPTPSHILKIHIFPCNRSEIHTNCKCASLVRVTCVKYLGIMIDDQLNWNMHITSTIARVRKLVYVFKNLRAVANELLAIQIYRALCECLIRYCICAWGGASKTDMIGLERAQRMVLKVLLFLPYRYPTSSVYELADVLSVRKIYIYVMLQRYHQREVPNLPTTHRRVERCPVPHVKSAIAQKHYNFLAPFTYNKCNKDHKILTLNNSNFKEVVLAWLKAMDYEDVENVLKVL